MESTGEEKPQESDTKLEIDEETEKQIEIDKEPFRHEPIVTEIINPIPMITDNAQSFYSSELLIYAVIAFAFFLIGRNFNRIS